MGLASEGVMSGSAATGGNRRAERARPPGTCVRNRRVCGGASLWGGVLGLVIAWSCSLVNGQVYSYTVLVWEDNFDGDSLNETVWRLDTGNGCNQG